MQTQRRQTIRRKNNRHGSVFTLIITFILCNNTLLAKEKPVVSFLEMRQDNVVIQQWDLSCGAAALTTLLKYQHGINTDEKTVAKGLIAREEYIKNPTLLQQREGFSLLDLKRYTEKIGIRGKAYGQLTLKNLENFAPILVPINLSGYNHFVIFRGKNNNRVLIADPAWGNRTLFISDFEKAWINYPKFGHVGFTTANPKATLDDFFENQLVNTTVDFSILH